MVLTIGGDSAQFWSEMQSMERQAVAAQRRDERSLGAIGAKLEGMTGGARKFVGALSSTVGIATGLLGAVTGIGAVVGVVAGLVGGPMIAHMRELREQAEQYADEMRSVTREREDLSRGLDAGSRLGRRQAAETSSFRRYEDERERIEALRREGKLSFDQSAELVQRQQALHRQRMANIKEAYEFEGDQIDARLDAERRAAQDAARDKVAGFERRDESQADRIRREAQEIESELRALFFEVEEGAVDGYGLALIERVRSKAAAALRAIEQEAAESARRARQDAAFDDRDVEADIQRLRGDEDAARLAEIRLNTEREIERVRRDAALTAEERERRIGLLRERGLLEEQEAAKLAAQRADAGGSRTVQTGLLGGGAIASRALGVQTAEQRAQRQREEQLAKLTQLVEEFINVSRNTDELVRSGLVGRVSP